MDLLDVAELTIDLPDQGLSAGSVGTIVYVFHEPNLAYEVEFVDETGRTVAMVALTPDRLRQHE